MGLKLDKAREIVIKFPNTPKASLAELLQKENKALYKDKEEARTYIRKATGSQGNKMRNELLSIAPQSKFPNGATYNPYQLPEQDHYDHSSFDLKVKKGDKIALLCDIHFPYQQNQALTTALDWFRKRKPTHIVLNGDTIDCFTLSSFEKDPSHRSFAGELKIVKDFLQILRSKFPTSKIIFKEGNHEERYLRFLRRRAPELLGIEVFNFDMLLGLKELDIQFVSNKKIIKCGKLNIVHGHEFGQQIFSPVNPARGLFLRSKANAICGHHHTTSSHSERTLEDKPIVCYSVGSLCELHPEYRPINNWNHGCAEIEIVSNDGWFVVENKKIIDGKLY